MLVLSRKFGERIQIGDGITVAIVGIRGNKVQLGIEAPQEVRVVRAGLGREEPRRAGAPIPAVSSGASRADACLPASLRACQS